MKPFIVLQIITRNHRITLTHVGITRTGKKSCIVRRLRERWPNNLLIVKRNEGTNPISNHPDIYTRQTPTWRCTLARSAQLQPILISVLSQGVPCHFQGVLITPVLKLHQPILNYLADCPCTQLRRRAAYSIPDCTYFIINIMSEILALAFRLTQL